MELLAQPEVDRGGERVEPAADAAVVLLVLLSLLLWGVAAAVVVVVASAAAVVVSPDSGRAGRGGGHDGGLGRDVGHLLQGPAIRDVGSRIKIKMKRTRQFHKNGALRTFRRG